LVKIKKKVSLQIPPGVDTGSRLRLRGEGEEGSRGGPAGDLYVIIYVEPHEFFEREGDDIIWRVPIPFATAALGGDIEVPTLDGNKTIQIPKGTQPGEIFRLRGEGIPHLHGRGRGDQIIQTTIKVPKKITKRQEELLEEFAALDLERGGEKKSGAEKKWRKRK
jgi:molecular chaperone DnaJ